MKVRTFETRFGQKLIDDFIKAQDQSTISKIAFRIDLLERFGPRLGMPYSKKITDQLYELRVRGKVEIRIIYAFKNNDAILLNILGNIYFLAPENKLMDCSDAILCKLFFYLSLRDSVRSRSNLFLKLDCVVA